ncbi:hypothetical protein SDC9_30206 [bioreactor metagenome]|uniref:Uncharacterized protein n=1 Tax=bioreactor metagenome TaxID=1076179 RepID=A0A644V002_9ZZZZ
MLMLLFYLIDKQYTNKLVIVIGIIFLTLLPVYE